MLLCNNIRKSKHRYKDYLETCLHQLTFSQAILQEEINKMGYQLKRLDSIEKFLQMLLHELKQLYTKRDAVALIRRQHVWKKYEAELRDIEGSHESRLKMSPGGDVLTVYPTVRLDRYCYFNTTVGQDIQPDKVKRAWILHAGELYVYQGEFEFWNHYYQSQIRSFVTLADNNEDVLVYLKQISGFVGSWSRNDIEMSGHPYLNGTHMDRFGSTFVLKKDTNEVHVYIDGHVIKVKLPVEGDSSYYSPIVSCVDRERDLLCVYTNDICNNKKVLYVYKIRYTFDKYSESTDCETLNSRKNKTTESKSLRSRENETLDTENDSVAIVHQPKPATSIYKYCTVFWW